MTDEPSVRLGLAAIAALGATRSAPALAIVCLAWGTGVGGNWVLSQSALQREATDAVIGRLSGFDELLVTLAMVTSAFLGAGAISWLGLAAAPWLGAILGGLAVVAVR